VTVLIIIKTASKGSKESRKDGWMDLFRILKSVSTETWSLLTPWREVDDDHVDGVRLRLLTAFTNGPIVHPPGDT
jgi:hypothetical protein